MKSFYATPEWRAVRAEKLAKTPICEVPRCPGRAKAVDHILARARGGAPYAISNLMSLCWSHHSSKTAAVDGGMGNPVRSTAWKPRPPKGVDKDGYPLAWKY